MLRRSVAARSNALARRVIVARSPRVQARFQSNVPSSEKPSRGIGASYVVAGGLTVLVGYALYRAYRPNSDAQPVKGKENYGPSFLHKTVTEANKTMKKAVQVFSWLRGWTSSCVLSFVEGVFEVLDYLEKAHPDEMDSIRNEVADGLGWASQTSLPSAERARIVSAVFATATHRTKELGGKAGYQFLDEHPILKEKLGSSYEELQKLTLKGDLTWIKTLREATDQMKELMTKDKLDERSIEKVREFMEEKASTLRSQVRAYELIYDFLGLELPDEYKDHIGDAEYSENGDVSGVPEMLEGRVRDMNSKDIMERKSGKSEK